MDRSDILFIYQSLHFWYVTRKLLDYLFFHKENFDLSQIIPTFFINLQAFG